VLNKSLTAINSAIHRSGMGKIFLKTCRLNASKSEARAMYWPFKTTVKFVDNDGRALRLQYAVSAANSVEAKGELERRFLGQEVFGYTIEKIKAATRQKAAAYNLPAGCVHIR
jgi:hypothetical protein